MVTKPKFTLCLALVLSGGLASISLGAEDTARFPIVDFGTNEIKVGFIDVSGKIAIPLNTNWWPSHQVAHQHFLEGLEPMQIRGKVGRTTGDWGYIDPQGKFAVEPQFSYAQPFSEGLAALRPVSSGKYGYIDHAGKYVISPQFDRHLHFQRDSPVSASAIFLATLISAALLSLSRNIAPVPHTVLQKAWSGLKWMENGDAWMKRVKLSLDSNSPGQVIFRRFGTGDGGGQQCSS